MERGERKDGKRTPARTKKKDVRVPRRVRLPNRRLNPVSRHTNRVRDYSEYLDHTLQPM